MSFTKITVLPSNLTVNGSLDLSYTQITALPSDLTVGKSLHLDHTQITALPDDLIVNGSLDLSFSQITALPSNLTVSKSLHLDHTQITALPDRLTVGSSLTLRNTQITTLPDYLAVGGRLFLNDAQIPDAELQKVKHLQNGDMVPGLYIYCDDILTFITTATKIGKYTLYKGKFPGFIIFGRNVISDGVNFVHCNRFRDGIAKLAFRPAANRRKEK